MKIFVMDVNIEEIAHQMDFLKTAAMKKNAVSRDVPTMIPYFFRPNVVIDFSSACSLFYFTNKSNTTMKNGTFQEAAECEWVAIIK